MALLGKRLKFPPMFRTPAGGQAFMLGTAHKCK